MYEEKEIEESEKPVPNNLEEAANHYASVTDPEAHGIDFISEVFIAGAEWQEKQMMKGAVEGEIFDDYDKDTCEHHLTILSTVPSGYKDGDKVRVIIIPYTDGNE